MIVEIQKIQNLYKSEGFSGLLETVRRILDFKLLQMRRMVSKFLPSQREKKLRNAANKLWANENGSETIKGLSHFKGSGRYKDHEKWEDIGNVHIKMFDRFCEMTNTDSIESMIEYGPGGGANAVKFAPKVSKFYGIDIAKENLKECGCQLEQIGFKNYVPVHIAEPKDCLHIPPVDFFLCVAVYQHFPSKEYGVEVGKIAYDLLKEQGLAIIQIRYAGKYYKPKKRDYRANVITFTSYGLDEFWNILKKIGFEPLYLQLRPETNYAYYFATKGKPHNHH